MQPPPPPPPPGAVPGQPPQQPQNGLGITALVLGIAAIPLACCYIGIPAGIAAVVLGVLGKNKADQGLATNRGMALAGLICGAIGAGLGILIFILSVATDAFDYNWNTAT